MHDKAIRFVLQVRRTDTAEEWLDLARSVENLGYDVVSLPDHWGPLFGGQFAPIPALAAVACVTSKVALSMFVLCNDLRGVAALARDVSTLDVLSNGRVELGPGAGWDEEEYNQIGLKFDRPGIRIERLTETIGVLKELFAGKTVTFQGEHIQLEKFKLHPTPVQGGAIPFVLGGGSRRILNVAGQKADVVSLIPGSNNRTTRGMRGESLSRESMEEKLEWVRGRSRQPLRCTRAQFPDHLRQGCCRSPHRSSGDGTGDGNRCGHLDGFTVRAPRDTSRDRRSCASTARRAWHFILHGQSGVGGRTRPRDRDARG